MWKYAQKSGNRISDISYPVEHLATFRVGPQFGIQWPEDGVKKLQDMERTSDVWAQKLILKLCRDHLALEDENGEIVETFPLNLIGQPTDYRPFVGQQQGIGIQGRNGTSAPENLLIFNVSEQPKTGAPNFQAEMHIFKCTRDSAADVVAEMKRFLANGSTTSKNDYARPTLNGGGRVVPVQVETTRDAVPPAAPIDKPPNEANGGGARRWSHRSSHRHHHQSSRNGPQTAKRATQSSSHLGGYSTTRRRSDDYPSGPSSAEPVLSGHYRRMQERSDYAAEERGYGDSGRMARSYSEYPIGSAFDSDVNTLNCYIDDIERFVARAQAVGSAQRELDAVVRQQREATLVRSQHGRLRRGYGAGAPPPLPAIDPGLQMRAQWPTEAEFVDILTKFKYCFNILGKIQHQIYDPDAPQLARYLFSPLMVTIDSARWALNKDVAPQITYPVLTPEANLLLQNHLTQREYDLWASLGDSWRSAPDFRDSYATRTLTRGQSGFSTLFRGDRSRTLPHGFSTSDIDRARSYDDVDAEARQLAERERILREKEAMLDKMEQRLNYDKESLRDAFERISLDQPSSRQGTAEPMTVAPSSSRGATYRSHSSQRGVRGDASSYLGPNEATSSVSFFEKQKAYLERLKRRGATRVAYVTHDRVGQNDKELTVSKGDYLEILNDSRNWWQCRDVNGTVGFVPNTIMTVVSADNEFRRPPDDLNRLQKPISVAVPSTTTNVPLVHHQSSSSGVSDPRNHFYVPRDRSNTERGQPDRTILKNGRY